MHRIKWSGWIIFNNCFWTFKKSSCKHLALQSLIFQPVLQLMLMPVIDLETVLWQEKKSVYCGSSKLLKKCLLLKWASQSQTFYKIGILFFKWIIKDYTGCRTWKTTIHIIRWWSTFMILVFGIKHVITQTCMLALISVLTVEALCLCVGGLKRKKEKFSGQADLCE